MPVTISYCQLHRAASTIAHILHCSVDVAGCLKKIWAVPPKCSHASYNYLLLHNEPTLNTLQLTMSTSVFSTSYKILQLLNCIDYNFNLLWSHHASYNYLLLHNEPTLNTLQLTMSPSVFPTNYKILLHSIQFQSALVTFLSSEVVVRLSRNTNCSIMSI